MPEQAFDRDPLQRMEVRIHASLLSKLREIALQEQRGYAEQAGVLLERAILRYKLTERVA